MYSDYTGRLFSSFYWCNILSNAHFYILSYRLYPSSLKLLYILLICSVAGLKRLLLLCLLLDLPPALPSPLWFVLFSSMLTTVSFLSICHFPACMSVWILSIYYFPTCMSLWILSIYCFPTYISPNPLDLSLSYLYVPLNPFDLSLSYLYPSESSRSITFLPACPSKSSRSIAFLPASL